jgi:predicted transporter
VGYAVFALGIVWFLIERGKMGFGKTASIITIVLLPIATIPLYIIHIFVIGISLGAYAEGLALLFVGSGFFAVGLIGVYINRKPKKIGLFFVILGLLFLLGAPLVNAYQVTAYRWGTWIATPYQDYTLPLVLVCAAFCLFGCASTLYTRLSRRSQNVGSVELVQQGSFKQVSVCGKQEQTVESVKVKNFNKLGFLCMVLGSLSLICAAIAYAPMSPSPIAWSVPETTLREYTISLIILCAALFVLGFTLMFHEKPRRFGFDLAISGSFALMFAAFLHGFRIQAVGYFDFGEYLYPINPFREYTLPTLLAGGIILVLGYALMLRKRMVFTKKKTMLIHKPL